LCFLSPEAYPFFLPAYMIYGLEDPPDSNVLMFTVLDLIAPAPSDPGLKEYFLSQIAKLTREQKKAITSFLEYVKEQHEDYLLDEADEALQSYWKKNDR